MDYLEYKNYLSHSGVKGQKWGVRRWQRADGTLTPEGRAHYGLNTQVLPNGAVQSVNFDASRGKDTYGILGKRNGKFAPSYSRTYKYAKKESKRYNKLIDEQAKKDYASIDEEYANREKKGHSEDNDAWRKEQRDVVSKNVNAGKNSVHQFLNDEWGYDKVKVKAAKEKGIKIANAALAALALTPVIVKGISLAKTYNKPEVKAVTPNININDILAKEAAKRGVFGDELKNITR